MSCTAKTWKELNKGKIKIKIPLPQQAKPREHLARGDIVLGQSIGWLTDVCWAPFACWVLFLALFWKKEDTEVISNSCDPMDCSLPGSSIHEILQARILEWVAISSSRGFSWPRDWTQVSCIAGRFFTIWATRETWHMLNGKGKMEGINRATSWISSYKLKKKGRKKEICIAKNFD